MKPYFEVRVTYATEGGAQGSAEFRFFADSSEDAVVQAKTKVLRDGRRRCAGKIDTTCREIAA